MDNEARTKENEISGNLVRISNAISAARIAAMFWIVATNYVPYIFGAFFGADYPRALARGADFLSAIGQNPSFADMAFCVIACAGWAGVVVFAFLIGFSLWFSVLKAGVFNFKDYFMRRFNGVYTSYFFAALVSFCAGIMLHSVKPAAYDLAALVAGASRYGKAYSYNPPLWFFSLLVLNYLAFALLPAIYSRFRLKGILAVTVASFCVFLGFGADYFLIRKGVSYPFMPFWPFVCLGAVVCHWLYSKGASFAKNIGSRQNQTVAAAVFLAGIFAVYWLIYKMPASRPDEPWSLGGGVFAAGIAGATAFMALGYCLPLKFAPALRWLSRGTFAVFLYHYLFTPLLAAGAIKVIFGGSFFAALITIYAALLVFFSFFQEFFDRTIGAFAKKITGKEYQIH